jgi:ankyrin repeat protein
LSTSFWTPLHWAAQNNHSDALKALLNTGAIECNPQDDAGLTPLHLAAANQAGDAVLVLLASEKVDPSIQNKRGKSPLQLAISEGAPPELIRSIVNNQRVDINQRSSDGATALHNAATLGRTEIVRELLAVSGVDITIREAQENLTAAEIAAVFKHDGIVDLINAYS